MRKKDSLTLKILLIDLVFPKPLYHAPSGQASKYRISQETEKAVLDLAKNCISRPISWPEASGSRKPIRSV